MREVKRFYKANHRNGYTAIDEYGPNPSGDKDKTVCLRTVMAGIKPQKLGYEIEYALNNARETAIADVTAADELDRATEQLREAAASEPLLKADEAEIDLAKSPHLLKALRQALSNGRLANRETYVLDNLAAIVGTGTPGELEAQALDGEHTFKFRFETNGDIEVTS